MRVNGVTLFNGPVAAGDTITLNGLSGNDTINIEDTFAGVTVTANGGNNDDTINVSPTARFLDNILGDVSIDGGDGTDRLNIHDQNNPFPDTFTVSITSVDRNASAPISYAAIDRLNLNGGTGGVTYNVEGTASGVTTTIDGGTGNDTFNVSPVARNLGTLDGILTVSGAGGDNLLNLFDQNNTLSHTFTVTGSTVARSFSSTINYSAMTGGVVIEGRPQAT